MEAHVFSENDPKLRAQTDEDGDRYLARQKAPIPYYSVHTIQPIPTMKPIINTQAKK